MCRFFSAIVLESGDILTSEYTDRHELLMRVHGVRDGHAQRGRFARVELLPPDDHRTLLDVETWNIQLDEDDEPEWWPARRDDVQGAMRRMVERMIVREPRDLILGGCWVVSDVAIGELAAGRIAILSGAARIGRVCDSARVERLYDSARIEGVTDSARIGSVSGAASIEYVTGAAYVECVYEKANVEGVYGAAQVGSVYGEANVGRLYDSARVGDVCGAASVRSLFGAATVGGAFGSAIVGCVSESARVERVCEGARVRHWASNAQPPDGWVVVNGRLELAPLTEK